MVMLEACVCVCVSIETDKTGYTLKVTWFVLVSFHGKFTFLEGERGMKREREKKGGGG